MRHFKISILVAVLFASFVPAAAQKTVSILQILDVKTGAVTTVQEFPYLIEAPNWTVDGQWLVFNSGGKIYRISPEGGEPILINTGDIDGCNNDHVLSADGKSLAISASSRTRPGSRIYTLPLEGGEPRLVTPLAPSYLHGWSPDGKIFCYCAERDGEYDIYNIPVVGGQEVRLTTSAGLDDGPEFSPDGKYIWFNSVRSGLMQVFRMKADGSQQRQMTFDSDLNSWFPHVSPDGKNVAFIAYHKGDLEPNEHLANKNVVLRVMTARGRKLRTVHSLFGGQGTINVNSWAPDSRHLAFVSYRLEDDVTGPLFSGAGDVGTVNIPGHSRYERNTRTYTLSGSGKNLWNTEDACYYVWKKVSGDFDISGDLSFEGLGTDPHRKMGFMVRESLDPSARYADLAIHGDGLTSLQYRPAANGETSEVQSAKASTGNVRARFSRRGNIFSIRTGEGDDDADLVLDLPKECYLGIFVCSHNEDVEETAYFRNVRLQEVSDDVRISIFCDHIGTMAAQEKISFFDAALKVRKAGCRGADIRVFQRPEEIRILDSLGFDHASAITDIDYSRDGWENTEERTIAFMKERGFDRVLIVPAILRDWNDEAAKSEARKRIAAFADRLAANGFDPLVEDYDNARSVCYNSERIDALFSLTPALGLVFDTGNFLFCGEDTLDNLAHFKGKTRHLHLKDRAAPDNMTCVPIGTGCAPISETVAQMLANGYEGYFTVEQYGSRNMLGDCLVSFRNIQDFIAAAKQ
jgi:Tol biopolymer transport system component/sugar phosphate isomerase/epimerase